MTEQERIELERQLAAEREARQKAEAACVAYRQGLEQIQKALLAHDAASTGCEWCFYPDEPDDRDHAEHCPISVMARVLAAPDPGAAVLEALRRAAGRAAGARDIFRLHHVVFDRWPLASPPGTWTPEALDALDPEERWQAIAFTLYTMLCEIERVVGQWLGKEMGE